MPAASNGAEATERAWMLTQIPAASEGDEDGEFARPLASVVARQRRKLAGRFMCQVLPDAKRFDDGLGVGRLGRVRTEERRGGRPAEQHAARNVDGKMAFDQEGRDHDEARPHQQAVARGRRLQLPPRPQRAIDAPVTRAGTGRHCRPGPRRRRRASAGARPNKESRSARTETPGSRSPRSARSRTRRPAVLADPISANSGSRTSRKNDR